MKTLSRVFLPLALGALCTWLVVRRMDAPAVLQALRRVGVSTIALYLATQAVTHVFRALRWEYLLRPLGVRLSGGRLLAISSVGFMTILALPFRLGEFVRPYLVKRDTGTSMTSVLGTVAVERIVDGMLVALLLFGAYLASGNAYSPELRASAWASLLVFVGAVGFLLLALTWTDATIELVLRVTLLRRLAPARADQIAAKLHALVRGFVVLREPRNLVPFLLQTVIYWGSNAVGMWLLARLMGLPISLSAALAAMSLTGIMLALPNPPGNLGLFQYGILLALQAYLPKGSLAATAMAYAWLLWALQALWYLAAGLVGMRFLHSGSLRDVVSASRAAAAVQESGA